MADFAEGATRERSVSSAFAKMDLHGVQLERAKEQMAIQSEKCYEDQAIQFLNAYWNEPSMRLAEVRERAISRCKRWCAPDRVQFSCVVTVRAHRMWRSVRWSTSLVC